MSKRFGWLLGLIGLVLAGFLVACGTKYNPSSDGLVIVGSQGSALLESFSFSLTNGHIAPVSNSPADTSNKTCVLPGTPYSIVLNTAGTFGFVILKGSAACGNANTNGIASFKVNSDGTISAPGTPVSDPSPTALAVDTSGKYLFVAEGLNSVPPTTTPPSPTQGPCPGTTSQFGICTYAIGSDGTLTPVQGTFNFVLPAGFQTPNLVALSPTPTTLPALVNGVQTSVCSNPGNTAPTNEFLYAADAANNVVYEYGVDMSTGALTNPPSHSMVPNSPTGATPSGVVVDPCDRFVYLSDLQSNQISGFTICSVAAPTGGCPMADGSLQAISGSPFPQTVGLGPGPLVADPFGNYLYVLETRSNQVLPFKISPVSGTITAGSAAATGTQPISIAIRGDNNWLFVTNFTAATLSQYSIIPATGALSELPAVQTDNQPWGVAVK